MVNGELVDRKLPSSQSLQWSPGLNSEPGYISRASRVRTRTQSALATIFSNLKESIAPSPLTPALSLARSPAISGPLSGEFAQLEQPVGRKCAGLNGCIARTI